eukprot:scaffold80511_cov26-Prasinocladus_malaysianus.AAC.2
MLLCDSKSSLTRRRFKTCIIPVEPSEVVEISLFLCLADCCGPIRPKNTNTAVKQGCLSVNEFSQGKYKPADLVANFTDKQAIEMVSSKVKPEEINKGKKMEVHSFIHALFMLIFCSREERAGHGLRPLAGSRSQAKRDSRGICRHEASPYY